MGTLHFINTADCTLTVPTASDPPSTASIEVFERGGQRFISVRSEGRTTTLLMSRQQTEILGQALDALLHRISD